MGNLAQFLKEMELGVTETPKCFISWESGNLGHGNTPRVFFEYEVTNILGHTYMGSEKRFWCTRPKGHDGGRVHGFIWVVGSVKACNDSFGRPSLRRGVAMFLDKWVPKGA
jgi:hypothetical protein